MAQIDVHLGDLDDVDAAVSVYERSNLVRRHGDWPSRSARVAEVRASLRDPEVSTSLNCSTQLTLVDITKPRPHSQCTSETRSQRVPLLTLCWCPRDGRLAAWPMCSF